MVKEGTAAHGTGADTSVPPTVPGSGKPSKTPGKESAIRRIVRERWNAISLSTKLVTTLLVLLTIGVAGISFSIRQLVSNYLLEKVDAQIVQQANLVFQNINSLRDSDTNSSGMTSYFLQIRDTDANILTTPLKPTIAEGVVSEPILPASGTMGDVVFGEPFTTSAIVHLSGEIPSRSTLSTARAPWRVVAMRVMQNDNFVNIVFIGLPLGDSIDTISSLTRYCIMVGTAVVLLGGVLGMLVVQGTLAPLKRIEKTAAKIAAGDLKQRIPAMPENTEIGSLSASLNAMLARIERSFHEQQETTDKMKRFVSDASHELRTPLAAIHGYAELYKMQRDMPGALERADESIAHIEASSSRMTVLVEDLLSLARLDEGRGIDITQQVNLTAIVKDAADDLHALDPERGITCGAVGFMPRQGDEPSRLMFELKDLPAITLHGDASRLRQVVTNIVGNIHRYTPGRLAGGGVDGGGHRLHRRRFARPHAGYGAVAAAFPGRRRGRPIRTRGHAVRRRALQRPRTGRARRIEGAHLRAVLHGRSLARPAEGRHRTGHGDRGIGGQGAPRVHLRLPDRRRRPDHRCGAADRSGRNPRHERAGRQTGQGCQAAEVR